MKRALHVPSGRVTVLAFGLLTTLVACGKATTPAPTAPSNALTVANAPASGGAIVSGLVTAHAGSLSVGIVGSNLLTAVDGAGRFRFDNAPAGTIELQFSGAGVDNRLAIGQVAERERLEVQVSLAGGIATLEAHEHVTPDDRAEIEGRIAEIDRTGRSLRIGTAAVSVPEPANIVSMGRSLSFNDLAVQQRVHVKGQVQGGLVAAQEIEVEDEVHPEPEPPQAEREFAGTLSSVGGSCPALQLTVAGTLVRTSGSTSFLKAACGDLKTGMTVEVKGAGQPDGTVIASRIQADDDGGGAAELEIEFTGAIGSLGGACPSVTFTAAGQSVTTSGATEFASGACADLRVGRSVQVKGSKGVNGVVAATRVRFER